MTIYGIAVNNAPWQVVDDCIVSRLDAWLRLFSQRSVDPRPSMLSSGSPLAVRPRNNNTTYACGTSVLLLLSCSTIVSCRLLQQPAIFHSTRKLPHFSESPRWTITSPVNGSSNLVDIGFILWLCSLTSCVHCMSIQSMTCFWADMLTWQMLLLYDHAVTLDKEVWFLCSNSAVNYIEDD